MNSNSELTPSETVETFEDDESEVENNILLFFLLFSPIHIIMTPETVSTLTLNVRSCIEGIY